MPEKRILVYFSQKYRIQNIIGKIGQCRKTDVFGNNWMIEFLNFRYGNLTVF